MTPQLSIQEQRQLIIDGLTRQIERRRKYIQDYRQLAEKTSTLDQKEYYWAAAKEQEQLMARAREIRKQFEEEKNKEA